MKAQEIKYLLLLQGLRERPGARQAELAQAAGMPASLVNRYLNRLTDWKMARGSGNSRPAYELTAKGRAELERASWELLALTSGLRSGLRTSVVKRLASEAGASGWRRAVLYGATPLAEIIAEWARVAGVEAVAICDEERRGRDVVRLGDLARLEYDCIVLADWKRADDGVLLRLLSEYGPVVNLFVVDGRSVPGWS